MPASLRIEIFPQDLRKCIDFYTKIFNFELVKHEGSYIYLRRDNIFIGAIEFPEQNDLRDIRRPMKGVEIVLEVDDLAAERDRIVSKGCALEDDIKLQPWGLKDFRLSDPDGYYLRVTTHSANRDGKGSITGE